MNFSQNLRVSLCCALASLAVGCSGQSGPALKIGVVNLETVIKESGEVDKFQQQASAVGQGLQNEINQFQSSLAQQYEKKVAEFGAAATDEQKKQLESMKAAQENQLMQVSQRARMYMENMEQTMVASFRQKIRPIVEKMSEEEKFDLIVEDTGFVIAYDKALDVSSKVATRLKMEAMNGPAEQAPDASQMSPAGGKGTAAQPSAGSLADDPLTKMLSSPSLPVPTTPAGSASAPMTPKEVAPKADAPIVPAETPKPDVPATTAEPAAGGN
ncbi:OmpH/Skp family outer membrane protein [Lacunimicrobium album]